VRARTRGESGLPTLRFKTQTSRLPYVSTVTPLSKEGRASSKERQNEGKPPLSSRPPQPPASGKKERPPSRAPTPCPHRRIFASPETEVMPQQRAGFGPALGPIAPTPPHGGRRSRWAVVTSRAGASCGGDASAGACAADGRRGRGRSGSGRGGGREGVSGLRRRGVLPACPAREMRAAAQAAPGRGSLGTGAAPSPPRRRGARRGASARLGAARTFFRHFSRLRRGGGGGGGGDEGETGEGVKTRARRLDQARRCGLATRDSKHKRSGRGRSHFFCRGSWLGSGLSS